MAGNVKIEWWALCVLFVNHLYSTTTFWRERSAYLSRRIVIYVYMKSPQEHILAYPHLSSDEKEKVEVYVDEHPEWESLLRDVKELERLAQDAQRVGTFPPGDEVLATHVMAQQLYPEALPSSLRDAFSRLEARMETDADLRAQHARIRSHLEALDAAFDPQSHFEELTGHAALRDADAQTTPVDSDDAKAPASSPADRKPAAPSRPTGSRTTGERVSSWMTSAASRWALATVALLTVAYGALYVGSRLAQDPLDRLASVNVDQDVLDSYQMRTRSVAPDPGSISVDQTYLMALRTLDGARQSTFGLFPHYDTDKLGRSEELLRTVIERTDDGSFVQLEALYYLGNVQLAQGDVEQARRNLKAVVQLEGRRAEEAYTILKELQQDVAPR